MESSSSDFSGSSAGNSDGSNSNSSNETSVLVIVIGVCLLCLLIAVISSILLYISNKQLRANSVAQVSPKDKKGRKKRRKSTTDVDQSKSKSKTRSSRLAIGRNRISREGVVSPGRKPLETNGEMSIEMTNASYVLGTPNFANIAAPDHASLNINDDDDDDDGAAPATQAVAKIIDNDSDSSQKSDSPDSSDLYRSIKNDDDNDNDNDDDVVDNDLLITNGGDTTAGITPGEKDPETKRGGSGKPKKTPGRVKKSAK